MLITISQDIKAYENGEITTVVANNCELEWKGERATLMEG